MRLVVLDSGVLLALWDPDDQRHHSARSTVDRCLAGGSRLVVPVTALSEVLVGAFRATPYAVRMVEGFVRELVGEARAVDRAVGRAAARLRAEFEGLPLADALVVATGEIDRAQEIVTTNGRLGEVNPRVRVLEG
jgi:predicted nucleic acid-binding protein